MLVTNEGPQGMKNDSHIVGENDGQERGEMLLLKMFFRFPGSSLHWGIWLPHKPSSG